MFNNEGYIEKELFSRLLEQGLKRITCSLKSMKKNISPPFENSYWINVVLLKRSSVILNIIITFAHDCSVVNAMMHLMAETAAYVIELLKLFTIKLLAQNYYL